MSIGNSNAVEFANEEQQPSIQSREFSLWSAVLLVAIDDLTADGEAKRSAEAWFHSTSRETGSFLWVCEALGISASAVLKAVANGARECPIKAKPFETSSVRF
jgi:hypothetical protein